jgi:hypothetical protein
LLEEEQEKANELQAIGNQIERPEAA